MPVNNFIRLKKKNTTATTTSKKRWKNARFAFMFVYVCLLNEFL